MRIAPRLASLARGTSASRGLRPRESKWWAWLPILDFLLLCDLAGKPYWWILLMCIPLVNIVILVLVWMAVAEARRKPPWLGILMIVPCANLLVLAYLALSE